MEAVTSDFIFQVLGAKEVEIVSLRIKVAQLEQQLQQLSNGSGHATPTAETQSETQA